METQEFPMWDGTVLSRTTLSRKVRGKRTGPHMAPGPKLYDEPLGPWTWRHNDVEIAEQAAHDLIREHDRRRAR